MTLRHQGTHYIFAAIHVCSFGSGCFVTVNGYSWILTCCHNFVADRNDGEFLKEGRGQEVVDLEEKMKEVMLVSFLVFADDTFHLPDDQRSRIPLTDFVPDISDCLVYPVSCMYSFVCFVLFANHSIQCPLYEQPLPLHLPKPVS